MSCAKLFTSMTPRSGFTVSNAERDPRKETKMAGEWEIFVTNAVDWLRGASLSHGAVQGFPDEQALTQYLALGLRKEFMEYFGLEAGSAALPDHIPFRDGPTPEDKAAWAACQDDKWIAVHGVHFVPDILIRQTPGKSGPVLPVEVKLLKTSGGQGFATAIGQALIYSARYGRATCASASCFQAVGGSTARTPPVPPPR